MIQFCLIAVAVFFTIFFYAAAKFNKQGTGVDHLHHLSKVLSHS